MDKPEMMFTLPSPPPLYHITLLRHGESVGNAEGFHQGQVDFTLNDRGRAQAQALAERWQSEQASFDLIISSPLERARETAEILAAALKIPLEFDPLWMERDNGILAGLRPEDAMQKYPHPPFVHPYLSIGETGESQWELYLRAGQAIQTLFKHPPGRYLVISHGGILNMVLYAILGITPHANFQGPRFRFGNTAFATLTYDPSSHKWSLTGLNNRSHWAEEE
jgi:broad specificity phosphatase PhoE